MRAHLGQFLDGDPAQARAPQGEEAHAMVALRDGAGTGQPGPGGLGHVAAAGFGKGAIPDLAAQRHGAQLLDQKVGFGVAFQVDFHGNSEG